MLRPHVCPANFYPTLYPTLAILCIPHVFYGKPKHGKTATMRYLTLILSILLATHAAASEITIGEPWARATAPGQENGAVYLTITSQAGASIVAVSSDIAARASLHSMIHENGVMKMRELEALKLPAKQEVKLNPGGNHIMLDGLKQPLKEGDGVALVLTIQFADQSKEKIRLTAKVKPLTSIQNNHEHQHNH